jgi:ubiquinone/menaquinone biosynthesis C-methylase UbiE
MHEKRFDGTIERLRAPERVARLEVERVVDLCLETDGLKSVLDVGVGSGLFAEAFAQRGLEVAGVDVNPEMIAAAQRFVPKGEFREATAELLPYPDASFDLVFFGMLLHESDEPLKVLQEAWRVSRRSVCILEWPYRDQEFGPPLAHRLKSTELASLARQVGFSTIENTPLNYLEFYRLVSSVKVSGD